MNNKPGSTLDHHSVNQSPLATLRPHNQIRRGPSPAVGKQVTNIYPSLGGNSPALQKGVRGASQLTPVAGGNWGISKYTRVLQKLGNAQQQDQAKIASLQDHMSSIGH